jgi:hypothetical protein
MACQAEILDNGRIAGVEDVDPPHTQIRVEEFHDAVPVGPEVVACLTVAPEHRAHDVVGVFGEITLPVTQIFQDLPTARLRFVVAVHAVAEGDDGDILTG